MIKIKTILLISFVAIMIPNIAVYVIHAHDELNEAKENIPVQSTNHKGLEQLNEGIFFTIIYIGYITTTILIVSNPYNLKPYYVVFFGTISIIIVYFLSKTIGFPAFDFYDWVIVDDTTNWKDVITKVAQQSFVIPLGMLWGIIY